MMDKTMKKRQNTTKSKNQIDNNIINDLANIQ